MKDLNICIDIDGTVTDPYYWIESCNRYFGTSITKEDVTQYNIGKILDVSEEDYLGFYEKYKYKIHREQEIRPEAPSIVNKLGKSHNIYFVTARDKSLTLLTHSYLKHHSFNYDELFLLGSHYKVEKAKALNSDIFIEDSHSNALDLSQAGFKVLLIDTNYNRLPLNDNIVRVDNWNDINYMVDELLLQEDAM